MRDDGVSAEGESAGADKTAAEDGAPGDELAAPCGDWADTPTALHVQTAAKHGTQQMRRSGEVDEVAENGESIAGRSPNPRPSRRREDSIVENAAAGNGELQSPCFQQRRQRRCRAPNLLFTPCRHADTLPLRSPGGSGGQGRGSWPRVAWRFHVSNAYRSLTVAVPRDLGIAIVFGAASVSERGTTHGVVAPTSGRAPSPDATAPCLSRGRR